MQNKISKTFSNYIVLVDIKQKFIRNISFSFGFFMFTNCCSLLLGLQDGCIRFWQCDQNLDLPIEDPTFEGSNCQNHSRGLLIRSLSRLIQGCCTEKLVKLMEQCRHFQGQSTSKTHCKHVKVIKGSTIFQRFYKLVDE